MSSYECGCNNNIMVEVSAGPHDRKNAMVSAICGGNCGEMGSHAMFEVNEDGSWGAQIPCQCLGEVCVCDEEDCLCDCELVWIVPEMKAGETRRFVITKGDAMAVPGVELDLVEDERVDFKVDGQDFLSYVFKAGIVRPFCYPVFGPNGKIIVREVSLPMKEGLDHPHHKGIWVAQGHVNDGEDNWSELNDHATTECQEIAVLAEGPVCGELVAFSDWMSGRRGNKVKMLEEQTRLRVYNTPDGARIMDWTITFVASEDKGFFFGDTKEAGTLSIRLKESMEERNTGTIRNSFGAVGEAENWGKRAEWVDYYGEVDGEVMGVTIMDHPDNHGYPAHWHVRSYGLFTANQWGLHDFTGDPAIRGDLAVKEGDFLTFRFRMYIHAGDTDQAEVAGQYFNFVFPPTVKVVE